MRGRTVFPILAGLVLVLTPLSPAFAAPPPTAPGLAIAADAPVDDAAMLEQQVRSIRSASRWQDALSTTAMLGGLFGLFAAGTLVIGAVDPRLRVRRRR